MKVREVWLVAVGVVSAACGVQSEPAATVVPEDRLSNIAEIQVYDDASCARNHEGSVYCWGDLYEDARVRARSTPEVMSNRPRKIAGIEDAGRLAGRENLFGHSIAVLSSGEIVSWSAVDLAPAFRFGHMGEFEFGAGFRRDRAVVPTDVWTARASGIFVDVDGPFAESGCFYAGGAFSCGNQPYTAPRIDLPDYDGFEWRREPGLVDVAFILNEGEGLSEIAAACLMYVDGHVECRTVATRETPAFRRTLELPSPARAIFGTVILTVFMEDGYTVTVDGNLAMHQVDGAPQLTQVDVMRGYTCGITRAESIVCWRTPQDAASPKPALQGVEHPVQVSHNALTLCVLNADGHVLCEGWNADGDCGVGSNEKQIEQPTYVVAPAPTSGAQ